MRASVAAHYHVWLPDSTTILRLVWMYDAVQEDIRERNKQQEAAQRMRGRH
jgi:hypothetical protein